MKIKKIITSILTLCATISLSAQIDNSLIEKCGAMEDWRVQIIEESGIIGGNNKVIYRLSQGDTIIGNEIYKPGPADLFTTSNIMAKISGIVKASNSVIPELREEGNYCAKLMNVMEKVRVLGLVNIEAMAQGSIITAYLKEPVKDTKGPYSKMNTGIPYTSRPKALQYDYKATVGSEMIRATGFSATKHLKEKDYPCMFVLLQHRVEDEKGNITAYRVGTAYKKFTENVSEWIDGEQLEIFYGDASTLETFGKGMELRNGEGAYYALNSKGEMVPVEENAWGTADMIPTHIIIWISSSSGPSYCGGVDNILWIDNLKLVE